MPARQQPTILGEGQGPDLIAVTQSAQQLAAGQVPQVNDTFSTRRQDPAIMGEGQSPDWLALAESGRTQPGHRASRQRSASIVSQRLGLWGRSGQKK